MASFDAEQKERELQAESAAWDTSAPVAAAPGDIPIIDVAEWFASGEAQALDTVAAQLRIASEEVGFYQLVGHDIAHPQRAAILEQTRRFHALPLELKRSIAMDRPDWPLGGVGYLGVGNRKLPARATSNLNEAFIIKSGSGVAPEHNQWLAEDALPGFRAEVLGYAAAIESLALRLLPMYAVALDLEPGFFAPGFLDPLGRLRLAHYPPDPPGAADGYGISPHVDTTFFTLLLQDSEGLVIYSHLRDQWINAPVVPGALVVNSGELLRQWSNDRFLSTRHFADNSTTTSRYSVPFFFNATADYPMECLPSCHGPGNPPKYPTISYLESQGVTQGE